MFDTEEELKMLTEIVEEEGTIEELESDMTNQFLNLMIN